MIEYVNIFQSDFLNYVKSLKNTDSKVNVNNVKIENSSKTNKHLNVNKNVNGFKRTTPKIPTMTSRIFHVSFVEKKTITFKNVSS